MRPLGKAKPGFEKRFAEIYEMITQNKIPKQSFLDKLIGKKPVTKEDLLQEWFANQVQSYETIKAPRVGRDKEADDWMKARYNEIEEKTSLEEFLLKNEGYYVIELAKEEDGVPVYRSFGQDENVFRGQFLQNCIEIIGEDLVNEAWESKLADKTLDYGQRLMIAADRIARENNLEHLKSQRNPPEQDVNPIEAQLHIVYSLANWLIFYGENGHGYEADY